jgi:hypothetical protein
LRLGWYAAVTSYYVQHPDLPAQWIITAPLDQTESGQRYYIAGPVLLRTPDGLDLAEAKILYHFHNGSDEAIEASRKLARYLNQ